MEGGHNLHEGELPGSSVVFHVLLGESYLGHVRELLGGHVVGQGGWHGGVHGGQVVHAGCPGGDAGEEVDQLVRGGHDLQPGGLPDGGVGVDPGDVVGHPDWPCLLGRGRVPVGHSGRLVWRVGEGLWR